MAKKSTEQMTPKQAWFVQEYLVDLNATQAAIRAGYSPKTAEAIGFENLRKPKIAAFIAEAQAKRQERTEISQDTVLENIIRIGNAAEEAQRYADALKAQEMLAKHVKLFTDTLDVTLNTPPSLQIMFTKAKDAKGKG